jgi:CRP-like cAMP-binding protein
VTEPRNPLELLVRKLEQHVPLEEQDRRRIIDLPYRLRTAEPSSYLVREGDSPEACAVLVSGFAFRQKLTGDGARQIVALHIPGDAVDFQHLFLDVADHNVQTLTRAEIAWIPRESLLDLARSNARIGYAILVWTLIEASIFREWILNVGRRDSRTRMAHVLCEFAIRLEAQQIADEYHYELPMTQEQLADVLGLTPVHVNRTLQNLEADQLITRSRRQVTIPDWKKLRDVGDFNERYLHLEPQNGGRQPELSADLNRLR